MKIIGRLVVAGLILAAPTHALAEKRICFEKVTHVGVADGYANYMYDGRVTGSNDVAGYGNWVVARDESRPKPPVDWEYAYYVQDGEVPEGRADAKIKLWVSHVSLYPLTFAVVRPKDKQTFSWMRMRAQVFDFLSSEEQARMTRVSPDEACKVSRKDDGSLDISACRCPG